jgi:4-diphosphocytidyl-2-C-methyl-D-erythritol kinase
LIVFPNCKINLGLQIKRKRADGFHALETIFLPVSLNDALEVVSSQTGETTLQVSGNVIDAVAEDNICIKAYRLLQQQFPKLPAVQVHLHKNIPAGAGLGGGSADGSFMLSLLNQKYNLGLSTPELAALALQLGSDCPFFVYNQACFASGRGEILQPLDLDLSAFSLVLVNPQIHINTGWAFRQLPAERKHADLRSVMELPVSKWQYLLVNDFEVPVFEQYPEIAAIKSKLYEQGAVFASMTGTGSTVFGLFPKDATPTLSFPDHYFVKQL